MNRSEKIMFAKYPKSIRKVFCAPRAERYVMSHDVKESKEKERKNVKD